jgi:hypothetical protein
VQKSDIAEIHDPLRNKLGFVGMFARTHVLKFCLAFSKASGVWGDAPCISVFFLIAFSFAHLSSKEKAGKEFALAKRP